MPSFPSAIPESVYAAIGVYLLVLEGILSANCEIELKTIGWELAHVYVERYALFFGQHKNYIKRYDPYLKLDLQTVQITHEEIKVICVFVPSPVRPDARLW